MSTDRFYARSASDNTDDWPFWFVADRQAGGLNVTARLFEELTGERAYGATLGSRGFAEKLADMANQPPHDGD